MYFLGLKYYKILKPGCLSHSLLLFPVHPFPAVLTCEIIETQVDQSVRAVKVEEDREGPFLIIQRAASDHSQSL